MNNNLVETLTVNLIDAFYVCNTLTLVFKHTQEIFAERNVYIDYDKNYLISYDIPTVLDDDFVRDIVARFTNAPLTIIRRDIIDQPNLLTEETKNTLDEFLKANCIL